MTSHSSGSRAHLFWIFAPDFPVGTANPFSVLHCSLKLFLPRLLFTDARSARRSEGSPCRLVIPLSPFPFTGVNLTKSPARLTPSQHLLLGELN